LGGSDGRIMAEYVKPGGKKKPKLSSTDAAEIVKTARECIEESWEHDRDNRRDASSDLSFLAGNQWPDAVRNERAKSGRPMLTINSLPQVVRQVTNDIRQADLAIKVSPVDDTSDPQLADIYNGLIRQIQYQSSAKHVYSTAAEHSAACGIGWFRVCTEYADDSAFDQEIRLKAIRHPLSVYCDPAAVMPDRSDANWIAVTEMLPKKEFKRKYPKAAEVDVEIGGATMTAESSLFWATTDAVRIAEYWRKVPVKKTLALLEDGQTVDITGKGEGELGYLPIVRTREADSFKVEMFIVSGLDVLDGPFEWAGKIIPIVPVIGAEIPLEEKTYRHGIVRFARDPAQLYNFYATATAEAIALAPKAPWLVTATQIGPYKSMWDTANVGNKPYLIYDPDPNAPGMAPKREHPPEVPVALMQERSNAAEDMKRVTGIYDASLGARSNEVSGIAIRQRQLEGDVANYHYADNLQRSLEHCGRILIDLIPKVYDNERVVRLMGEDGSEEPVRINVVAMSDDGVPMVMNDLSIARFDIRVTIGASYSTKRQETAEALGEFMKSLPPEAALPVGYLVAKNSDWSGAEEIAKVLRNMVPPELLADPDDPSTQPPPPEPDPTVMAKVEESAAKTRKLTAEAEGKEIENALMIAAPSMMPPVSEEPYQPSNREITVPELPMDGMPMDDMQPEQMMPEGFDGMNGSEGQPSPF
jgi:hypothetical protein